MTERLLIVGGTGFIGKNLALSSLEQGFKVTVISLNLSADSERIDGVEYVQADITDFVQLQERLFITTFDYVVNLSGYVNHSRFMEGGQSVIDAHFYGVSNLIQLLNWKKIKRFVQIGSSDEYGEAPAPQNEEMREFPISSYSMGKVAATHLLQMLSRTEEFPAVTLRLFLVYGEGQSKERFLPQIVQGCLLGKHFPASEGKQLRDFCYVDDITRGILLALKSDDVNGEVINLASGVPISIRKIVELVQETIGKGTPDFGAIPYRIGENMALYADNSKAARILGWLPTITIEEGIEKTVSYYQKRVF